MARRLKKIGRNKPIVFSDANSTEKIENAPVNSDPQSQQIPAEIPADSPVEKIPDGFPERTNEIADLDRISFKITDGKIDVESVRESKAESVKKILQASVADEKFKAWSGITPPPTAASAPAFTPLVMGQAFDMVAYVQAGLYGKKYAVNPAELYPLLAFSEIEHRQIDEISAQCANKYLPASLANWSDLAICGMTLIGIYRAKSAAVDAYVKKKFDRQVNAPSHDEPRKVDDPTPKTPNDSPNGSTPYGDAQKKRSLG